MSGAATAWPRRAVLAAPLLAAAGGRPGWRLGAYGGAGCTGRPEVAAFEAWLGRPVPMVLDFLEQSQGWDGVQRSAAWIAGCWSGTGRGLVLSVPLLVDGPAMTLREGAAGAHDAAFRRLARTLVEAGFADAILRLGWEFNGDWFRWSARDDPAAFAACWRRVAGVLRGTPGARFRLDWNPNLGEGPVEAAWPGAEHVDLIGLDAYNQAWPRIEDPARRWRHLLDHPAGLVWHRDFAARHGKPRSFAEWGTGMRADGHGGGDDPLYIRNMLAWMGEGGPVDYACYWNYRAPDYDAKLTDGRLPRAAAALRAGLGPGR